MKNFDPFITFIMCSRKKDNPDSQLLKTLDSIALHIGDQAIEKIEILIKFDTDDDKSYKEIIDLNYKKVEPGLVDQPNLLESYPFRIRYFIYNRGEGRRSLHNDYMFLFSQRDPRSKFISFITDDCIMVKDGLFKELESLRDKDWCILGEKKPVAKLFPNYRENQDWRTQVSMFPIVSSNLLHVLQNMGWQVNIDNWLTLLHVILYHKYDLDLFYGIDNYITREGGTSKEEQYGKVYNDMEITNNKRCTNTYYFDLIEQACKNVYLNYKYQEFKKFAKVIEELK